MVQWLAALAVRLDNAVHDVREREEGQGLVEYVTLIALIALGLFVAIIFFRDQLGSIFSQITDKISSNLP
jgi:Flp pilus assembly pilin Flp